MKAIKIDNKYIGKGHKPYIIAELSANHNGDINRALKLIEIAKESGADAVKIQTYTADTMTIDSNEEDFKIKGGLWDGYSLYELYREAHTPWEWHKEMFSKAKSLDLTIFSSPFDESAVDFLNDLNVPAFKLASFEMTDLPLIKKISETKKPLIMSTGMASLEEIKESYTYARECKIEDIIILHCVSGYPTPTSDLNLLSIKKLQHEFPDALIGLSDHTLSNTAAITSIALGTVLIEKHFTDSRTSKGPDSAFSLEPQELSFLCKETHEAWKSLGKPNFNLKNAEKENIKFRRSIYVTNDVKKGDLISPENIRRIRPGFGLEPKYYEKIIGKTFNKDIPMGTALSLNDIEDQ